MAALRIWWLPVLMGIGQLLAWPLGPLIFGTPPAPLDAAVTVVVTVVVAVALGWRRRAPVGALVVVAPGLMAGTVVLPPDALSVIALADLVVLFSLSILCPARVTIVSVAVLSTAWIVVVTSIGIPDLQVSVTRGDSVYIMVAALGRSRGRWARARAAAAARLVAAEAEQRRAAEVERERLARELHDVTAHHLTAIVVHAGAARRLGADRPELVARALEFAADTGRRTLTALNRLVTVIEPAAEPLRPGWPGWRRGARRRAGGRRRADRSGRHAAAAGRRRRLRRGAGGVHERDALRRRRRRDGPVAVTADEARVTVDNLPAAGRRRRARWAAGLRARARRPRRPGEGSRGDVRQPGPARPAAGGAGRVAARRPLRRRAGGGVRPPLAAGPSRGPPVSSERVLDAAVTVCVLLPSLLVLLAAIERARFTTSGASSC